VPDLRLFSPAEHIGFAIADGAGAGFAHVFEQEIALVPVAPRYGQFLADDLQIEDLRGHERRQKEECRMKKSEAAR
jgi:hypothetical protein